jgi:Secretion system C-terminal sorting domain
MKTFLMLALLCGASIAALAQLPKTGEVQITSGTGNEYNPSFARKAYSSNYEWLVYERQSGDSSFIIGKIFRRNSGSWDSSETVLSATTIQEMQKYPVIASKEKFSMALWQQKTGTYWNIYYCTYSVASQKWAAPLRLTRDTLNNINVLVQSGYADSQFVVAWQNRNILRIQTYPFASQSISDTIAVSNYDAPEFDLGVDPYAAGAILYTIQTSGNARRIVTRDFRLYPTLSYGVPDTLHLNYSIHQPRFAQPYLASQWLSFHMVKYTFSDVFLYSEKAFSGSFSQMTNSINTHVSYRNQRVSYNPIITVQGAYQNQKAAPYNHVLAYECADDSSIYNRPGKTDLIIMQCGPTDSIVSTGNNCNPTIGTTPCHIQNNNYVPVVWESNRSGKNHLYWKNALQDIPSSAPKNNQTVNRFELSHSYPNPFNSAAVIEYTLSKPDFVTLDIMDCLGRKVSTLVSGTMPEGRHRVSWNADRYASGVYYYRLTAGQNAEVKKLVLLR